MTSSNLRCFIRKSFEEPQEPEAVPVATAVPTPESAWQADFAAFAPLPEKENDGPMRPGLGYISHHFALKCSRLGSPILGMSRDFLCLKSSSLSL